MFMNFFNIQKVAILNISQIDVLLAGVVRVKHPCGSMSGDVRSEVGLE